MYYTLCISDAHTSSAWNKVQPNVISTQISTMGICPDSCVQEVGENDPAAVQWGAERVAGCKLVGWRSAGEGQRNTAQHLINVVLEGN